MAEAEPAAEAVDLLVLGAGCAGMAAALAGAALGLRVLLVEKARWLGGTTAYSAGTAWVPGTDHARRAGVEDDLPAARTYLDGLMGTEDPHGLRAAFLAGGAEAIRFLEAHSELRFLLPPLAPDYRDGPGAAAAGRALVAAEFDGRRLGPDLALIRPPRPGFTILGGMMVGKPDIDALLHPLASRAALRRALSILARHARDRLAHPRGTRLVMGQALVGRLLASLRHHGVTIRLETQAERLLLADGAVTGAVLLGPDGRRQAVQAARGVVLATGGFSGSPDWRRRLLRPAAQVPRSVACPDNTGDGFDLAAAAGARPDAAGQGSGAFWMPTSVLRTGGGEVAFPHIILDRAKPGVILVNGRGARFVNEGLSYHDVVTAMLGPLGDGPDRPAWLVCDDRALRRYGLGLIHPRSLSRRRFRRAGYLHSAATPQALARRIGVDPEGLAASIARHGDLAARGVDEDFGKGSTRLNRQNGDPRQRPNPCLGPIDHPPFHAVAVWPADLATAAGLPTDAEARVLRPDGKPVPGLYAAGNDMASLMRGTYPGPGTTIGPALVFGYRAARHAAMAAAAVTTA
ncbi:FAD-dependent oxidoreductase [Roseomonas sp. OT10]|uniref:FAD-dependent oxidoreductase n=1 Tax=Roseomonas cutis TaxID=2897332 RepID=UPI001E4C97C3|nr:FAD-dependent oxidoreductase [Roseomonas sp. OT10]UFN47150.1 FAD-dependent oxidoreductase [Roseomonas sp. OT10]